MFTGVIAETERKLKGNIDWINKYKEYADAINSQIIPIKNARKVIKQWYPFKLYLPINCAMKEPVTFSLRYMGKHIAEIQVGQQGALLRIKGGSYKKGAWDEWGGVIGRTFRKTYKGNADRVKRNEHFIETHILSEMQRGDRNKFNGKLTYIQPVVLGNAPFQMLLPINGNTGTPIYVGNNPGQGHIDILARYKRMLTVIELKKPRSSEAIEKCIKQALIYTTGIACLLRSESGKTWWNNFGYTRPLPDNLEVNAIVMVDPGEIKLQRLKKLVNEQRIYLLADKKVKIHLGYIHYHMDSNGKMDLKEIVI